MMRIDLLDILHPCPKHNLQVGFGSIATMDLRPSTVALLAVIGVIVYFLLSIGKRDPRLPPGETSPELLLLKTSTSFKNN